MFPPGISGNPRTTVTSRLRFSPKRVSFCSILFRPEPFASERLGERSRLKKSPSAPVPVHAVRNSDGDPSTGKFSQLTLFWSAALQCRFSPAKFISPSPGRKRSHKRVGLNLQVTHARTWTPPTNHTFLYITTRDRQCPCEMRVSDGFRWLLAMDILPHSSFRPPFNWIP